MSSKESSFKGCRDVRTDYKERHTWLPWDVINDARFNSHNSYKTSYVKDPNWEWLRRSLVLASESAPPSSRQRGVRASERGSQLPNLKRSASQYWRAAEQTKCKYTRMFSQYFLCLTEMRLWFAKMYPYVPLRGSNKYKKKDRYQTTGRPMTNIHISQIKRQRYIYWSL